MTKNIFKPCDCVDCIDESKEYIYCEYCNTNHLYGEGDNEYEDDEEDDEDEEEDEDENEEEDDTEEDTFTGSTEDTSNYVIQGISQKDRAEAKKRLMKYFQRSNKKREEKEKKEEEIQEKKEEIKRQHQLNSLLKYYGLITITNPAI